MCINLTNKLHICVRVYCNRSQTTLERVKNKKVRHETKSTRDEVDTRRSRVARLLFFTRCDDFCDLLQYTRTERCNQCVLHKKGFTELWVALYSHLQEPFPRICNSNTKIFILRIDVCVGSWHVGEGSKKKKS